jgi:hypothetical protein
MPRFTKTVTSPHAGVGAQGIGTWIASNSAYIGDDSSVTFGVGGFCAACFPEPGTTYLVSTTSIVAAVNAASPAVAMTVSMSQPNQPSIMFAPGHVVPSSQSVAVTVAQVRCVAQEFGTQGAAGEDTIDIHGQYVATPAGHHVVASLEPKMIDKNLAIRELNRELEGWTPHTNTGPR